MRALKELVFRHIVHSQKTITYLLLPAKQRVKCAIAVPCKFNNINFTTYDNKIVIVSL